MKKFLKLLILPLCLLSSCNNTKKPTTINEEIENSSYIMIKDSGHASMYEKPREFLSILKGYLSVENYAKIV